MAEFQIGLHTVYIDDADYENVMRFKWHALIRNSKIFVCHREREKNIKSILDRKFKPKHRKVFLHRFLSGAKDYEFVRFRDGDGLNCRRENIQIIKRSNRGAEGFYGVKAEDYLKGKRFVARIKTPDKKWVYGKHFNEILKAANDYDEMALFYYGEEAKVNFKSNKTKWRLRQ